MRTKLFTPPRITIPWLERNSAGAEQAEPIKLEDFPFTLGRNESCDYPIPSSRVSREHAEISRSGEGLRVRDLGSTNGTFLNGQRVAEAKLSDGDLLAIADVEFTVHFASDETPRKTVTQVMPSDAQTSLENSEGEAARELVQAVRMRQETLLHRAARNRFQPIVDLTAGQTIGYEALPRPHCATVEPSFAVSLLQSIDCRLTERTQHLQRLLAAEQAARMSGGEFLFLNLQPAEVGADLLPQSLARLQRVVGKKRIVAEIPDSAVVDIPYFRNFLACLRDLGLEVAYDGFTGGQHQVNAQRDFAPNYLKLAPALARGVDRSKERQQQIRILADAARGIGAELIATGIHSENEAHTCRDLGCRLAQGDHFGEG